MASPVRGRQWSDGGRRLAAAAVVVLGGVAATLAAAVAGPAGRASADPVADCSATAGVVVAVDLRPFGGQIQAGCDPTTTTGLDALEVAGFTPTGTSQYGLAFICLIDGYPPGPELHHHTAGLGQLVLLAGRRRCRPVDVQPGRCGDPRAPGGQRGSMDLRLVEPLGRQPGFTPSQVRGTDSGPPPTTTTTSTVAGVVTTTTGTVPRTGAPAGTTPPGGTAGDRPGSPAAPVAGAAAPSGPATTSGPGSAASAEGGSTTTSTTGGPPHGSAVPRVVAAVPDPTVHGEAAGSPVAAVIAVLAVVALAGAAGLIARRRRRTA